jgi:4-amino-4-deoxy-L-arabinose transferase-like glycosyltransferase
MTCAGGRRWVAACWLALASMAVTAALLLALPRGYHVNESSDYLAFYEPVARNVLSGDGLVTPDGSPATRYPPGYPLILASLFGLSEVLHLPDNVVHTGWVLLGMGLTTALLYLLASEVWSARGAALSALAWMTCPLVLWTAKQPGSELPFLIAFYAALVLYWRNAFRGDAGRAALLACGACLGVALLIRPIAIGIPVVLASASWLCTAGLPRRRRLAKALLPLVGVCVVVMPWEGWAYGKTGCLIPLSTGGVPSYLDGLTFAAATKGYRQDVAVPADVLNLMQEIKSREKELTSPGEIASAMKDQWRQHPGAVLKLLGLKLVRSWYGTDSQRMEFPLMVLQVIYLGAALVSTRWAWRRGGGVRGLALLVWVLVFYFWGMTTLVLPIVRYMLPALGLLFLLLPAIPEAFRKGRLPSPGPPGPQ